MSSTLSPRDLAIAIGVSESSIKRWADDGLLAVARTAGGHRRISRAEAIRFIRDQHLHVADAAPLGMPEITGAVAVWGGPAQPDARQLFDLLSRGESDLARGLILSTYLQGSSVAEICDHWIAPAMDQLGELWTHSEKGVYIEHRATDICIHALNQFRSILPEPKPDAPAAVGAAPSGDIYLIPSLAAAIVLASEGFRAVNLGPDTPLAAIEAAVTEYRPRIAWLSVSMAPSNPNELAGALQTLDDQLAQRGVKFIIGGRCARQIRSAHPLRAFIASSMSELVAFVRGAITAGAKPSTSAGSTD